MRTDRLTLGVVIVREVPGRVALEFCGRFVGVVGDVEKRVVGTQDLRV